MTLEHKKEDTHNGATTSPEKREENDVNATCFSPFFKKKKKKVHVMSPGINQE